MQKESLFSRKVAKRLKEIPDLWFQKIQQVALRGTPDYLICYRGWFIAWELKVPPNKVKAGTLQEYNLKSIHKAGGVAREVTPQNLEEAIKELRCLPQLKLGSREYSVEAPKLTLPPQVG